MHTCPAPLRKYDLRKPNCQADLQQGDTPNTPLVILSKVLRAKLAQSKTTYRQKEKSYLL